MNRILISLFLAGFLLAGCRQTHDKSALETDLNQALETPGDFRLSELVSDVEIIQLDTVKEAYFVNSMGFTLTDHYICFACDTADNSWMKTSLINDVFGIEPVYLTNYNPTRREIVTRVMSGWAADTHDMACLRNREVKFPEARDRLAAIIESPLGLADMTIVVMKLK